MGAASLETCARRPALPLRSSCGPPSPSPSRGPRPRRNERELVVRSARNCWTTRPSAVTLTARSSATCRRTPSDRWGPGAPRVTGCRGHSRRTRAPSSGTSDMDASSRPAVASGRKVMRTVTVLTACAAMAKRAWSGRTSAPAVKAAPWSSARRVSSTSFTGQRAAARRRPRPHANQASLRT